MEPNLLDFIREGGPVGLTVATTALVKAGFTQMGPKAKMFVALGAAALFTGLTYMLNHTPVTSAILADWVRAALMAMGAHALVTNGIKAPADPRRP